MGKIKLNLVSGAVAEKPLLNAFKANNNSYIVFDNEMNGSMGLPIILVCKLIDGKLTKIVDQNEWQIVKEYLKNIIAGNQIEYIKVANELTADDIYYTQLTLPVPSFDALKNAYKVPDINENSNAPEITPAAAVEMPNTSLETQAPVEPVIPVTPVEPVISSTPVVEAPPVNEPAPVTPIVPEVPNVSVISEPSVDNIAPVTLENSAPVIETPVAPTPTPEASTVESTPTINLETPMPTFGTEEVAPVEPEVVPTSPLEPIANVADVPKESEIISEDIFKEQKEAFMQACENMFDALVQKFQKELENRK